MCIGISLDVCFGNFPKICCMNQILHHLFDQSLKLELDRSFFTFVQILQREFWRSKNFKMMNFAPIWLLPQIKAGSGFKNLHLKFKVTLYPNFYYFNDLGWFCVILPNQRHIDTSLPQCVTWLERRLLFRPKNFFHTSDSFLSAEKDTRHFATLVSLQLVLGDKGHSFSSPKNASPCQKAPLLQKKA